MENLKQKTHPQFNDEYINMESNASVPKENRKSAENQSNERFADMDTESNYKIDADDIHKKMAQSGKERGHEDRYSDMDTESNYD